jgi:hypothetical protein
MSVLHDIRHDEGEWQEEETQQEKAEEAVPLSASHSGRPERNGEPDDQPDNSDAEPHCGAPLLTMRLGARPGMVKTSSHAELSLAMAHLEWFGSSRRYPIGVIIDRFTIARVHWPSSCGRAKSGMEGSEGPSR